MKKNIVVLFLLIGLTVHAQKKPNCSIEIQGNLPYYLINYSINWDELYCKNYLNAGTTFKVNALLGKWVKLGIGLGFSTKNYALEWNGVLRKEYFMDYKNIPIELEIRFIHQQKWDVGLLQGFIMNYRYNYDVAVYTNSVKTLYSGKGNYKEEFAYTYRLGVVFSYQLSPVLNVNIVPYADLKYKIDRYSEWDSNPNSIVMWDQLSMGLNIGLEYKFNVNE